MAAGDLTTIPIRDSGGNVQQVQFEEQADGSFAPVHVVRGVDQEAITAQLKGRKHADHTFQDGATATGDGSTLTLDGQQELAVQVEASASSFEVIAEGTIDGSNWHALTVIDLNGMSTSESIVAAGVYAVGVDGLAQVRMRLASIADNSVTVEGN